MLYTSDTFVNLQKCRVFVVILFSSRGYQIILIVACIDLKFLPFVLLLSASLTHTNRLMCSHIHVYCSKQQLVGRYLQKYIPWWTESDVWVVSIL